ncbi:MAG TPA: precorrin-3B C(17)-methyltransferase [Leptolyngbyaceae cyanobacterium M33_DOE_097]|uniref:Precorrin-3B C(17)-methyltransferase n=1 Tax=Oscillatoriales cyanobacterium SpSt-418 TaxID=2282169 RepID=A0A7C3KCJ4_9CYAN|nr:precorrin-3B C(17)-methyltransferase [Leptolyngbyaceae cyanobacterium M33_DOE_097]
MSSLFQSFAPIAAIATNPTAVRILQPFLQQSGATLWVPDAAIVDGIVDSSLAVQVYAGSLKEHLATLWENHTSFVFCLATGAVVRLIAPLLNNKATDPAVVVLDETGKFVVSLCGGHQAGADQLTRLVALTLEATPVLTGAANRANLPGIDVLGEPFGWRKGNGDWTQLSAAIAQQQLVHVVQTAGSTLWQAHLPAEHPFLFNTAPAMAETANTPTVWISEKVLSDRAAPVGCWHPRVLWVGIGCERGTPASVIASGIQTVFQQHQLAMAAIAGIATIDLKADEVGLLEVCQQYNLPLRCFTAESLQNVAVPTPSAIVAAEVGTPSVAEAAALLASQPPANETSQLIVPKTIFRAEGQPGAVTIAIAQAQQEYTDRTGKLWLVGIGPGALDQITPAAKGAIAQADVVIGYSLYVDLIRPLLRPGQIIEALPITQERQRAERAIALANWGLTVAVISSGDCGIYGMAGLVLEQLQTHEWDGQTPEVQVFPGITALQAAASRVGAPLMHDFCAISLSDLLTPWPVIEQRLQAVAQADFVVALYNPKSQNRTEQIAIAQQIFLQHRSPNTPVAIVRSVYRPDQAINLTTLAEMLQQPIDMLTTVLIGNQSSRTYAGWFLTPRGYLGFGDRPKTSAN